MVYAAKDDRNEKLVQLRVKDPKKWTWGELGKQFAIHRSVAKEIFERDLEKFANEDQIDRYLKLTAPKTVFTARDLKTQSKPRPAIVKKASRKIQKKI